jgi:GMP synthase (glutamine-hydrolysing)
MRVLAILHQHDAGPGVFADVVEERGGRLDRWMISAEASPPGDPFRYDAVFSLGGAVNVHEADRYDWLREEQGLLEGLLAAGIPLLGLCLGGQILAAAAGGTVRRARRPEIGWCPIAASPEASEDPLLAALPPQLEVLQWHSYEFTLPPAAVPLAYSDICLQACRIGGSAWAFQFHPEVDREILDAWIDDYRADEDAIALGIDPEQFRVESADRIIPFNRFGRDLCGRWLDLIAR